MDSEDRKCEYLDAHAYEAGIVVVIPAKQENDLEGYIHHCHDKIDDNSTSLDVEYIVSG